MPADPAQRRNPVAVTWHGRLLHGDVADARAAGFTVRHRRRNPGSGDHLRRHARCNTRRQPGAAAGRRHHRRPWPRPTGRCRLLRSCSSRQGRCRMHFNVTAVRGCLPASMADALAAALGSGGGWLGSPIRPGLRPVTAPPQRSLVPSARAQVHAEPRRSSFLHPSLAVLIAVTGWRTGTCDP